MASFWNEKARKWIEGRKNIDPQIGNAALLKKPVWFHCASTGEYEQALPLIKLCKEKYPDRQILTTFYSPSGFEYAKMKFPAEQISYLPFDFKKEISDFIAAVDPVLVFIIKYEFWYHLLSQLHQKKIPVFLVSGIFRKQQMFFHPAGIFPRKMLGFFTHLFVQNEESRALLRSVKIENVTVAGDTRFDRVAENRHTVFQDEKIGKFVTAEKIFVAGSVWDSDIPVLKKMMEALPPDWKIILAPHEPAHFSTDWISEAFCNYTSADCEGKRILIIDTIGILSRVYRYACFAYVGGGFGQGIHNILEPAVYLKPVLIGRKYQKYQEAVELVKRECVFEVNTENAGNLVKRLIFDKNKYHEIAGSLSEYISANTNLSDKILVFVSRYIKE